MFALPSLRSIYGDVFFPHNVFFLLLTSAWKLSETLSPLFTRSSLHPELDGPCLQ